VAEHAGVSRMTVSNVMRARSGKVSAETMARVLQSVRELEYTPVPQPTTQSRHVETRIIGLVFDRVEVEDPWGLPTYRGMRDSALACGYDLLTLLRAPAGWMLDAQELHFLDRRCDGLIFVVPKDRYSTLEALVQHQVPVVTCFIDDAPAGVASVVLDNAGAMRQAVEHLIAHGHRKILHLIDPDERSDFLHRRQGYEAAMRVAGLEPIVERHQTFFDVNLAATRALLKRREITAIVCPNDSCALQTLDLLERLHLSVPRDLSLIGMDDLPAAMERGLTTFRVSCEDVGRLAIEAVVRLMGGADFRDCSRVLPVEMVERNSVGSPRKWSKRS
jgi:DNA-binding LacI/PurR family transcriptional regulator